MSAPAVTEFTLEPYGNDELEYEADEWLLPQYPSFISEQPLMEMPAAADASIRLEFQTQAAMDHWSRRNPVSPPMSLILSGGSHHSTPQDSDTFLWHSYDGPDPQSEEQSIEHIAAMTHAHVRDGLSTQNDGSQIGGNDTNWRTTSAAGQETANKKDTARQLALERNRKSAKRFQEKRKMQEAALQDRVQELQTDNAQLRAEAVDLQSEVIRLKTECLQHVTCDCGSIRSYLVCNLDSSSNPVDQGGGGMAEDRGDVTTVISTAVATSLMGEGGNDAFIGYPVGL